MAHDQTSYTDGNNFSTMNVNYDCSYLICLVLLATVLYKWLLIELFCHGQLKRKESQSRAFYTVITCQLEKLVLAIVQALSMCCLATIMFNVAYIEWPGH